MGSRIKGGMYMDWEMIGEVMSKYWVEQVCVVILAVITW